MVDRGTALRLGGAHRFDDRVEDVALVSAAKVLASTASMSRKASRKKSRSICCLPTLRSSSAILAFARASSDAASGAGGRKPPLGSALPIEARHAHRPIGGAPFIEKLTLDLQFVRNRRQPFPALKPENHALLELSRKYPHPLL